MADPKTLTGFDNWDDMSLDVAEFIAKVGAAMEEELKKSDASQVPCSTSKGPQFRG